MKRVSLIICLVYFLASGIYSQDTGSSYAVTSTELENYISFLASDMMKGRSNGSAEMKIVSSWIAGEFEKCGLSPAGKNGSWFQEYEVESGGRVIQERNVLGMIEGSDPVKKNEYILVTAHFDHVGIRRAVDGDSIYNGADDNAAGTVTLLSVARTIMEKKLMQGRTIIFAAVSGEEIGLRGSRYLAANPTFNLPATLVNINFEMTGHSEFLGSGRYYITGGSFTNLDELINDKFRNEKCEVVDSVAMTDRLFFMSDNAAFARISRNDDYSEGIPGATFATTTFADYIHSPYDEAELFDYANMARLVDYFSDLVIWFSNTGEKVVWTDQSFRRPEKN